MCVWKDKLLTGCVHGAQIWDLKTGRYVGTFVGHSGGVRHVCVWKDKLLTGSYDKTAKLWDLSYIGPRKEMFLANVLTGFAKDYGTTKQENLKRPPDVRYKWHPLWEDASAPGIYDSVRGGPHSGTIMYVTYEKGYAYPSYLIEFS